MIHRLLSTLVLVSFLFTSVIPVPLAHADDSLALPQPGSMVNLSPAYMPVVIKGLKVHPENPLLFDFIIDTGNSRLKLNSNEFKSESQKLIKYFLASLTIKEDDLWVNLSPYEKDRIIPQELGQTELGRDMLAQDYILKQLTASLIYPEKKLGKEFWDKVYAQAREKFGVTDIPVNTFNKVWIVADKAKVLERNNAAYIVGAHLKVMLEEDYMALSRHVIPAKAGIQNTTHTIASQVIRSIILPALEKEINQGQNFASLRQMFYSMILATWYKRALKNALLNQVYSNKGKVKGVEYTSSVIPVSSTVIPGSPNVIPGSPNVIPGSSNVIPGSPNVIPAKAGIHQKNDIEGIYQQYLKAYKKGVFNYIKEEPSDVSLRGAEGDEAISKGTTIPRKYFSGGLQIGVSRAMVTEQSLASGESLAMVPVGDMAMAEVTFSIQTPEYFVENDLTFEKINDLIIPPIAGTVQSKTVRAKKDTIFDFADGLDPGNRLMATRIYYLKTLEERIDYVTNPNLMLPNMKELSDEQNTYFTGLKKNVKDAVVELVKRLVSSDNFKTLMRKPVKYVSSYQHKKQLFIGTKDGQPVFYFGTPRMDDFKGVVYCLVGYPAPVTKEKVSIVEKKKEEFLKADFSFEKAKERITGAITDLGKDDEKDDQFKTGLREFIAQSHLPQLTGLVMSVLDRLLRMYLKFKKDGNARMAASVFQMIQALNPSIANIHDRVLQDKSIQKQLGGHIEINYGGSIDRPWMDIGGDVVKDTIQRLKQATNGSKAMLTSPEVKQVRSNEAKRILVVDDESFFRRITGGALRNEGYTVELANDGVEALKSIAQNIRNKTPFDLIVTDINMPNMHGFALINIVKRSFPNMRIVEWSGYGKYNPDKLLVNVKKGFAIVDAIHKGIFSAKELSEDILNSLGVGKDSSDFYRYSDKSSEIKNMLSQKELEVYSLKEQAFIPKNRAKTKVNKKSSLHMIYLERETFAVLNEGDTAMVTNRVYSGAIEPYIDHHILGSQYYGQGGELFIGDKTTSLQFPEEMHINVQDFNPEEVTAQLERYVKFRPSKSGKLRTIRIDVGDTLMVPIKKPRYHSLELAQKGIFSSHELALAKRVSGQLVDPQERDKFMWNFNLRFRIFKAIRQVDVNKAIDPNEFARQFKKDFDDKRLTYQELVKLLRTWRIIDEQDRVIVPLSVRYELWTRALTWKSKTITTSLTQEDIDAVAGEMVVNKKFIKLDRLIRKNLPVVPVYQIVSWSIRQIMETEIFRQRVSEAGIMLDPDILAPRLMTIPTQEELKKEVFTAGKIEALIRPYLTNGDIVYSGVFNGRKFIINKLIESEKERVESLLYLAILEQAIDYALVEFKAAKLTEAQRAYFGGLSRNTQGVIVDLLANADNFKYLEPIDQSSEYIRQTHLLVRTDKKTGASTVVLDQLSKTDFEDADYRELGAYEKLKNKIRPRAAEVTEKILSADFIFWTAKDNISAALYSLGRNARRDEQFKTELLEFIGDSQLPGLSELVARLFVRLFAIYLKPNEDGNTPRADLAYQIIQALNPSITNIHYQVPKDRVWQVKISKFVVFNYGKLGEHAWEDIGDRVIKETIQRLRQATVSKKFPELPEMPQAPSSPAMTGQMNGQAEKKNSDAAVRKGGIDFNAKNMGLDVAKEGNGIEMKFDPAMVAEFQRGDFAGVVPIFIKITPMASAYSILGLKPPQGHVQIS